MKSSRFGLIVASAVAGLVGSGTFAQAGAAEHGEDKGCYRKHCGSSVKGHEGTCGGTKVDAITDQKTCEDAGGAWATAKEAEKYKH
jgi:hypothetical protein